ncbi:MAG: hypothetical protein RLZZ04_4068 [Cyanobacteriota bacterium]|jgi:uncharacterized integral membrane protein
MSRIKILLLILIIAALSIVFIQNREPITLKLFCADSSTQSCLYQTPALPLAVWIALATLTGAIANLLVQTLNRYGYQDSSRKKPILDDDLYPSRDQGKNNKNNNGRQSKYSEVNSIKNNLGDQLSDTKSYEVKQEPKNVERSGSTYSYQYREASDRPKDDGGSSKKNSLRPEVDSNPNHEADDEDWI